MSTKSEIEEIPWPGNLCITCLEERKLSLEHIFPDALGGALTCRFLCEDCNSLFGHSIDASAKSDPSIRSTARAVAKNVPKIVADIDEGQRFLIHTEVAMLHGKQRGGEIQGTWHHMPDGSAIAPEDQAIESLRGRMRAEGLRPEEIEASIARYTAAKPGEVVNMSPTWAAKKLAAYLAGPDLRAPEVDPLLFVKIAYEFTALLVGQAIYALSPQLEELRAVLKETRRDSDAFKLEKLTAKDVAPFHGIAFEGNKPHAVFQIRLFGKPAYRVHLRRIAVQHKPIAYTHDLETGEHWHNLDDSEAA